jgi:hypothetical protein
MRWSDASCTLLRDGWCGVGYGNGYMVKENEVYDDDGGMII